MRTHRFWYRAGGAVIVAALGVTAGCGSSGSAPARAASRLPWSGGQPSTASPGPTSAGTGDSASSHAASPQQSAQAVQGPAAVPTSAQLAALRVAGSRDRQAVA